MTSVLTTSRVLEHLTLVVGAGLLTILLGIFLGVIAYLHPKTSSLILWTVDVLQTIPVLATLGILMLVFGASATTVILGLMLYSLLPVVRNTYIGLQDVPRALKEAATGMGMTSVQKLFQVELQLALPMILTGVRIAIVTSIGTAVFGAIVGGGGLGVVINRAILLQDMGTLMQTTFILMLISVFFDFGLTALENRLKKQQQQTIQNA